jgi:hypothetical protein
VLQRAGALLTELASLSPQRSQVVIAADAHARGAFRKASRRVRNIL